MVRDSPTTNSFELAHVVHGVTAKTNHEIICQAAYQCSRGLGRGPCLADVDAHALLSW